MSSTKSKETKTALTNEQRKVIVEYKEKILKLARLNSSIGLDKQWVLVFIK
ncbi:13874_t:CDS:1, partial [Gigaspora rosea]